jgi:two-component system sensor histidine kinase VicK
VPILKLDKKLMDIIFQNLLSNALKYTPEGGKINLKIKKGARDVTVAVIDSGYGIPLHQQDKIFSKLFRADNVRQKDTQGTGLGLYMVKSIVEHSGGKIWFKSKENKGTTFFVSIPLKGMKKKEGSKKLS